MSRIVYVQYTNPAYYPPLEHSSRILAEAGWEVCFLGICSRDTESLVLRPHNRIKLRLMHSQPAGWRQKIQFLIFIVWISYWVLRFRPTWIYGSDYLACPAIILASYISGTKIVYHEHDSPLDHSPTIFIRTCLIARRWVARRAAFCVLPNQERAREFAESIGERTKIMCVWNCSGREEVVSPRLPANIERIRIFYHGSVVPARLPLTVLEALALLPEWVELSVVGYETVGHAGYLEQLRYKALELGISSRIEIVGSVPSRKELLNLCQQCDIGLALMPEHSKDINERNMAGASNKPFDYLACGLALLISDLPDWQNFFAKHGYGLTCMPNDAQSIAKAIRWYIDNPRDMRNMGERGRQKIATQWNYEEQFKPVLYLLQK